MVDNKKSLVKTLSQKIVSLGPAFFIIGYVVGTGSVTSMIVAGSEYGMALSWALLLSCFFTYFLLVAIGKLTIVSGSTLMFLFKKHFGKAPTLFIMGTLLVSIVSSVIGVMGIVTEVFTAWLVETTGHLSDIPQLWVGVGLTLLLLSLFWRGKHAFFIKLMAGMVGIMAVAFLVTSAMIINSPTALLDTFGTSVFDKENADLVLAGMVGTTMAGVVLVSRSILVQEKGWTLQQLKSENRDARIAMTLTFLVCFAIMVCAVGVLFSKGLKVESALDMVKALEPLAGNFAMTLFTFGILGAGLSSIFPNLLLFPWLLSDYSNTKRDLKWISRVK